MRFISVAAGSSHSAILTTGNRVLTCGSLSHGQLGRPAVRHTGADPSVHGDPNEVDSVFEMVPELMDDILTFLCGSML